jgi:hypothetical protein
MDRVQHNIVVGSWQRTVPDLGLGVEMDTMGRHNSQQAAGQADE